MIHIQYWWIEWHSSNGKGAQLFDTEYPTIKSAGQAILKFESTRPTQHVIKIEPRGDTWVNPTEKNS